MKQILYYISLFICSRFFSKISLQRGDCTQKKQDIYDFKKYFNIVKCQINAGDLFNHGSFRTSDNSFRTNLNFKINLLQSQSSENNSFSIFNNNMAGLLEHVLENIDTGKEEYNFDRIIDEIIGLVDLFNSQIQKAFDSHINTAKKNGHVEKHAFTDNVNDFKKLLDEKKRNRTTKTLEQNPSSKRQLLCDEKGNNNISDIAILEQAIEKSFAQLFKHLKEDSCNLSYVKETCIWGSRFYMLVGLSASFLSYNTNKSENDLQQSCSRYLEDQKSLLLKWIEFICDTYQFSIK